MSKLVILFTLRMLGMPRWIAQIVMVLILAGGLNHAWSAQIEGRVVGVSDGDTITVLDANKRTTKVRLRGIDAPESKQAFGQVSKRSLSELVYGKMVQVRYDAEDRYGRVLGVVLSGGSDVNLIQVHRGMAWHYKHYQRDQSAAERRDYARAEDEARAASRGLWGDQSPVAPWDFRRSSH